MTNSTNCSKNIPFVYIKWSSSPYTSARWQLPERPNGFRWFITNTDREGISAWYQLPMSLVLQEKPKLEGLNERQHTQWVALLLRVNSRLQLCHFIVTTVPEGKSHASPKWKWEKISCLEAASCKIERWIINGLVTAPHKSILPCTKEDHRVFPQDLRQIVVEPCLCGLCGKMQDHQGATAEPFSYTQIV